MLMYFLDPVVHVNVVFSDEKPRDQRNGDIKDNVGLESIFSPCGTPKGINVVIVRHVTDVNTTRRPPWVYL
jgi:hypothetical protein